MDRNLTFHHRSKTAVVAGGCRALRRRPTLPAPPRRQHRSEFSATSVVPHALPAVRGTGHGEDLGVNRPWDGRPGFDHWSPTGCSVEEKCIVGTRGVLWSELSSSDLKNFCWVPAERPSGLQEISRAENVNGGTLSKTVGPVPNNVNMQEFNPQMYRTTPDAGSKAVIAALKTLQEKMRRLEIERAQAERNVNQLCRVAERNAGTTQGEQRGQETREGRRRQELVSQLQSAEARCSLLEKQLDYMRNMVEKAEQDRNTVVQKQAERQKDQAEVQTQLQKLEMLERECLKLSNTQSVAERKIELLEQKQREEEHERKLVQEKAAESTGPSHSVSANVQSILHMMKHHNPKLCDRVRSFRGSGSETRRGFQRALSPSQAVPILGNLSELLLALQDELGQMSFEHQELVQQVEDTGKQELKEDLERELDRLVKRMEEKAAQITQLKRHQLAVQRLKQRPQDSRRRAASADGRIGAASRVKSLPSSPAQKTPQARKGSQGNQSDRHQQPKAKGPVRLQTNLQKDDIMSPGAEIRAWSTERPERSTLEHRLVLLAWEKCHTLAPLEASKQQLILEGSRFPLAILQTPEMVPVHREIVHYLRKNTTACRPSTSTMPPMKLAASKVDFFCGAATDVSFQQAFFNITIPVVPPHFPLACIGWSDRGGGGSRGYWGSCGGGGSCGGMGSRGASHWDSCGAF
ncbi:hypothetical protein AAFF_G00436290 [Aldrovandia affinis]|uniref:Centrosomal protein 57kDa-like protein 1 n=1 Tax=Aldrovandia affinis TaxID=143900 RepID=A0AAD7S7X0_9TELE|nr:hypothetical protein AAFF_G00436290 [Aldrovandia affinis]